MHQVQKLPESIQSEKKCEEKNHGSSYSEELKICDSLKFKKIYIKNISGLVSFWMLNREFIMKKGNSITFLIRRRSCSASVLCWE